MSSNFPKNHYFFMKLGQNVYFNDRNIIVLPFFIFFWKFPDFSRFPDFFPRKAILETRRVVLQHIVKLAKTKFWTKPPLHLNWLLSAQHRLILIQFTETQRRQVAQSLQTITKLLETVRHKIFPVCNTCGPSCILYSQDN